MTPLEEKIIEQERTIQQLDEISRNAMEHVRLMDNEREEIITKLNSLKQKLDLAMTIKTTTGIVSELKKIKEFLSPGMVEKDIWH